VDSKSGEVTASGIKKQQGTVIDITEPVERAAGWQIILPTDKDASCYHGSGTDWCVSKRNQENFESYFYDNKVTLIFCLNDRKEKWAIAAHRKLANKSQFFDQHDKKLKPEQFAAQTGLDPNSIISRAQNNPQLEPARELSRKASIPQMIKIAIDREKRDADLEQKILAAKNAKWANEYVREVMKEPWPAAEEIIAKDPMPALNYALYILEKPWPAGEAAIAKDPETAYTYAEDLIKKRWPAAEEVIAKSPLWAVNYASNVMKKRWPEAEPVIATDPVWACDYARDVLKKPWPAAEPVIATHGIAAYSYARDVLKDPNPKTWAKRFLAKKA
jgi:lambda repressor-like predicted transcriptional regulator